MLALGRALDAVGLLRVEPEGLPVQLQAEHSPGLAGGLPVGPGDFQLDQGVGDRRVAADAFELTGGLDAQQPAHTVDGDVGPKGR